MTLPSLLDIIDSYRSPITYDLGAGYSYQVLTAYGEPCSGHEVDAAWDRATLPVAVRDLWMTAAWIHLYYRSGSEGLEIFSPIECRCAMADPNRADISDPENVKPRDIVVGKFQALDDYLVYSPEDGWLVSKPYDSREDWLHLGETLIDFLVAYRDSVGRADAWERQFWAGS